MLKNFLTVIIDSADPRGIQETLVSLSKQDKSKGLKVIINTTNKLFSKHIQNHKYENIKVFIYRDYSIDALIRKITTQYVMVMTPKEFIETNYLVKQQCRDSQLVICQQ
jgi:FAD synthase